MNPPTKKGTIQIENRKSKIAGILILLSVNSLKNKRKINENMIKGEQKDIIQSLRLIQSSFTGFVNEVTDVMVKMESDCKSFVNS